MVLIRDNCQVLIIGVGNLTVLVGAPLVPDKDPERCKVLVPGDLRSAGHVALQGLVPRDLRSAICSGQNRIGHLSLPSPVGAWGRVAAWSSYEVASVESLPPTGV